MTTRFRRWSTQLLATLTCVGMLLFASPAEARLFIGLRGGGLAQLLPAPGASQNIGFGEFGTRMGFIVGKGRPRSGSHWVRVGFGVDGLWGINKWGERTIKTNTLNVEFLDLGYVGRINDRWFVHTGVGGGMGFRGFSAIDVEGRVIGVSTEFFFEPRFHPTRGGLHIGPYMTVKYMGQDKKSDVGHLLYVTLGFSIGLETHH